MDLENVPFVDLSSKELQLIFSAIDSKLVQLKAVINMSPEKKIEHKVSDKLIEEIQEVYKLLDNARAKLLMMIKLAGMIEEDITVIPVPAATKGSTRKKYDA